MPSSTSVTSNSASSISSEALSTAPYQRQFENIARNMKILVGAHYVPFFESGTWAEYWDASNGTPLLGQYNSGDPTVVSKHIDWATGHGIGLFTLDWYGPASYVDRNVKAFLQNELIGDIQFMIMYDSSRLVSSGGLWDIDDPANRKLLQDDFRYLVDNYFAHPSYFKIDGRQVIYFWASISWKGNIGGLFDVLRSSARSKGYDVFVIGDPVHFYDPSPERITPFDGITQWANYSSTDPSFDQNIEATTNSYYSKWASMAKNYDTLFIPSVLPGFRRIANPEWPILPRSTDRLMKQLELALKYLDPRARMMFITTFNDWTENTQVEPSVEDKFNYLRTLRDSLAGQ